MTIGNRIKRRRIELNISQTELAEKCNISKQTLYKYENNIVTNIPSDKVEEIANHLNTSPAYIMGWSETMNVEKIPSSFSLLHENNQKYLTKLSNYLNIHPESVKYISILCKNERIENNYTEKFVAQQCNLTLKEYIDFENCFKNIGAKKINTILCFFHLELSYILGYLAGATGNANHFLDIAISTLSSNDQNILKEFISLLPKMTSEELNYFIDFLGKNISSKNSLDMQKLYKALELFYQTQNEA